MACSLDEEQFETERIEARCAWSVECYPGAYTSLDECVSDWGDDPGDGLVCDYDADAAKDCLAGLDTMECSTDGSTPQYPEACAAVYTNCTGSADR